MVGGVVLPPRAPTYLDGVPGLPASGGGLAPCRARLPGKGGPSLADILLLRLNLGPSELHVGSSNLLVLQSLTWVGASILILCLCTVWATDPGFVAPTEAPGPAPNALLSVVGVGPNKCTGRIAEGIGPLRFPLLLHFRPVSGFPMHRVNPIVVGRSSNGP